MNSREYWQLFLETGAPEFYMMYTRVLKTEEHYVSEYHSLGTEGQRLQ